MWYARWSKSWRAWQTQHLEDKEKGRADSKKWITQSIRVILGTAHERWKFRGKALDGEVHNCHTRSVREILDSIYGLKEKLPRRYHFLIGKDIGERLRMEPKALQRWIQSTEPILRKGLRAMCRRSRVGKRMEAWLRWKRGRRRLRRKH